MGKWEEHCHGCPKGTERVKVALKYYRMRCFEGLHAADFVTFHTVVGYSRCRN